MREHSVMLLQIVVCWDSYRFCLDSYWFRSDSLLVWKIGIWEIQDILFQDLFPFPKTICSQKIFCLDMKVECL